MKTINKQELIKIIDKNDDLFTITTINRTKLKGGKKAPYENNIFKKIDLSGITGQSYQESVNEKLEDNGKTANFKSNPRPWGIVSENKKWVYHKDNIYLYLIVKSSSKPVYMLENGKIIKKEEIKDYLIESSKINEKQLEAGLNKKEQIILRTINIDNIKNAIINNENYKIK